MERTKMHLPCLNSALRRAGVVAVIALSTFACAQDQSSGQNALPQAPAVQTPTPERHKMTDYTKPRGYFPNPLAPYQPQDIPVVDLANTPRITSLIKNGALY